MDAHLLSDGSDSNSNPFDGDKHGTLTANLHLQVVSLGLRTSTRCEEAMLSKKEEGEVCKEVLDVGRGRGGHGQGGKEVGRGI